MKESVVHSHHVYKEVWRPVIGQFPVLAEPTNCHGKRVVAFHRDGEIVGHVPRELASCYQSPSFLFNPLVIFMLVALPHVLFSWNMCASLRGYLRLWAKKRAYA